MHKISFKVNSGYNFNRQKLRKKINDYLDDYGLEDVELSMAVVGKRKMRQLNQDYMDRDKVCDVLAFPQKEKRRPDGMLVLGDIVVCYPKAQQEAIDYQENIDKTIWDFVRHALNRLTQEE